MLNYLEKYSNETKKINEKAAKFVYDPRLVEDLIKGGLKNSNAFYIM
jgi:hypothetical protein